ncbi:Uncharacterised protein [Vibrio cholerae]|uniref:Uncharacterized protein n=1 Tax=Vibrio cholerae TaxID=666 RepID=A0A655WZ68_VIBCL|nr:Uncharacterised protein [Vibrio cholerae]CSB99938.1 Uncharacterised protein [Vibrio cholerae]
MLKHTPFEQRIHFGTDIRITGVIEHQADFMGKNFVELLQTRQQRIVKNRVVRIDLTGDQQREKQQDRLGK